MGPRSYGKGKESPRPGSPRPPRLWPPHRRRLLRSSPHQRHAGEPAREQGSQEPQHDQRVRRGVAHVREPCPDSIPPRHHGVGGAAVRGGSVDGETQKGSMWACGDLRYSSTRIW